jgi:hypothetical protein
MLPDEKISDGPGIAAIRGVATHRIHAEKKATGKPVALRAVFRKWRLTTLRKVAQMASSSG